MRRAHNRRSCTLFPHPGELAAAILPSRRGERKGDRNITDTFAETSRYIKRLTVERRCSTVTLLASRATEGLMPFRLKTRDRPADVIPFRQGAAPPGGDGRKAGSGIPAGQHVTRLYRDRVRRTLCAQIRRGRPWRQSPADGVPGDGTGAAAGVAGARSANALSAAAFRLADRHRRVRRSRAAERLADYLKAFRAELSGAA